MNDEQKLNYEQWRNLNVNHDETWENEQKPRMNNEQEATPEPWAKYIWTMNRNLIMNNDET